jgi:signal transduction histidine kinase
MARFEVQARVLDLLGLQQIANCPTAISELFKNAWDAYAQKVMLDVYPDQDQAILWDDGIGMTEDELIHRWLVVGAAGKESLPTSIEPPEGMVTRPIQGEKGIGRLAISTLGDTLLLISRSHKPKNPSQPFVALLVNWNIAQNEHLRLSDFEIPYFPFTEIEELTTGIVALMAQDLRSALLSPAQAYAWDAIQDKKKRAQALELRNRIIDQLTNVTVNMSGIQRAVRESTREQGTLFCILHLKNEFRQYVRAPVSHEKEQAPQIELVQLLSNFRNHFEAGAGGANADIKLDADIRRWDYENNLLTSLFRDTAAFVQEDLRFYDHHVSVDFDEDGRFSGRLEIYRKQVSLPSREEQPKHSLRCGPFRLRFWYYQDKKDSILDAEQWSLVSSKLSHFGGLMIYRDGLRVLPYGRPEFDWLSMEERRSKGAGYYFFSYRRMFGYVSISHHENPRLLDKAGREGLIINRAYRDLREVLENFFIYLARHYFKADTEFFKEKAAIKEEHRKVDQERKRAAEVRRLLREEAVSKLRFLKEEAPVQMELAFQEATQRLHDLEAAPDPDAAADTLLRFENRMVQVLGSARFVVPRNVSTNRDNQLARLRHDHGIAFEAFSRYSDEVRQRFQNSVRERFPGVQHALSRKRAFEQSYAQALAQVGKAYRAIRSEFDAQMGVLDVALERLHQEARSKIAQALLVTTGMDSIEKFKAVELENFAEVLGAMSEAAASSVEILREHQERLATYLGGFFDETRDELLAAQAGEIEELREQVDQNLELVQLGLAVEIIDHDLNKLFVGIRASLSRLQNLLRSTPKAGRHLEDLRSGFVHLEQRFRQMSPIYRGSYRVRTEIDGKRVISYCRDFMGHQLRSAGVELDGSEAFAAFRIREVEAVILPVFINLIDNAIFWMRNSDMPRRILLDVRDTIVTICDTGPGIHPTDLERIFEMFYTNKQGGRGLGLYIARANLQRYGHEIWATNEPGYRALPGACICIRFHEDVFSPE